VLLTATDRLTFGERQLNQADHRHVALAVLDAAKDAGNRWFRTDVLGDVAPHPGVRSILLMGSTEPTHAVDVSEHLESGIASLRAHKAYLAGLGRAFDPAGFLRESTRSPGRSIGVEHAVAFEQLVNVSV
jgi:LmbE family N-acetylglucosaminyl deacetylase